MTRLSVALAALAVLVAIAVPLSAQPISLKANVPFEFSISNKTLPAGEYAIMRAQTNRPDVVRIQSSASQTAVLVLVGPAGNWQGAPVGAARLVFNRYGDKYFLSQIWDGYSSTGQQLPVARSERELAMTASVKRIEILAMLIPR